MRHRQRFALVGLCSMMIACGNQPAAIQLTPTQSATAITAIEPAATSTLTPALPAPPIAAETPTLAFITSSDENQLWVANADGTEAHGVFLTQTLELLDEPDHLTYMAPAWSPDGSKIAFALSQDMRATFDIYVGDLATGTVRRLTHGEGSNQSPTWSPDGAFIAFVSERDGNQEIYRMKSDGTDVQRLTDHFRADTDPAWAPDGSVIAFSSARDFPPNQQGAELYLMKPDGTELTRITTRFATNSAPAWSPDSQTLAYSYLFPNPENLPHDEGALEIHRINRDGSNETTIVKGAKFDPAWTSDGKSLIYSALDMGYRFRIHNLETGEDTFLTIQDHDSGILSIAVR